MKLINRETGNNCYEIIKEYKGGLTARFIKPLLFLTAALSSLLTTPPVKTPEIERIVHENFSVCMATG